MHSIAPVVVVATLSKEAVEPAEVGHQVLVGVDVLVDVLVVVIIERTAVETTAAVTAVAPPPLRLLETAKATEATVAGAGLLRVFLVYIRVIIDVLVNVVTEVIAVGFEFPMDDVRQT